MKKLFGVLVLLAFGPTCWSQATITRRVGTAVPPQAAVASKEAPKASVPAPAPRSQRPPEASRLAWLRKYDFTALLQGHNASCTSCEFRPLNGFYGPTRYRMELALVTIARDVHQPLLYHVQGKSRYKKAITAFNGTITLTQVVKQPTYSAREIAESATWDALKNLPNMYTALGQYELRENASQRGAGVYRGTVALDFTTTTDGQVAQQSQTNKTLTQGGELKYAGTWTSNATKRVVPVTWVGSFLNYHGPQGFSDFNIGDRGISINPKYAHLGWNNFWENDEWWADTPKSQASL